MCGRYTLHSHPAAVALHFGLAREPAFAPRYNIAPAAEVLVVRDVPGEARAAATMRWGLVPSWAKDPAAAFINARAETAAQRPAFRDAFRKRRCLLPANGFYEWQVLAGRKQPYYVRPVNDELFGIAGLYEIRRQGGLPVATCAILTTEANAAMRAIHERMPAIVRRADYTHWLAAEEDDPGQLRELLAGCDAEDMALYAVSARVNSARNDDPALIEAAGA